MREIRTGILVVGGGVAGAWSLRTLRAVGVDALLLDHRAAGQGQTIAAQGILHSGVKYGLDGTSRAIGELLQTQPPVWLTAMEGRGPVTLEGVEILTREQFMWAGGGWFSSVAASIGSRSMRGEVREVPKDEWPEALASHRGKVHAIREVVLATRSVLRALLRGVERRAFCGEMEAWETDAATVRLPTGENVRVRADGWVFTAGTGNETLARMAGLPADMAQRRPLTMVMLAGALPPLFGHAVAARAVPRLTVSSHILGQERVWYLGGELAEKGPTLDPAALRAETVNMMRDVFPALALEGLRYAAWSVDRAEPRQPEGKRPDGPELAVHGNVAVGWPTKMVYAPALAAKVVEFAQGVPSRVAEGEDLALPPLALGKYPWEVVSEWSPLA